MSNKTDELRVWDRTRATETARNPSRSASAGALWRRLFRGWSARFSIYLSLSFFDGISEYLYYHKDGHDAVCVCPA